MGLFNSLIALLAIKILFLKVNAISLDHDPPSSQLELKKDDALKIFNNSMCNESRNVSRLVPYTETYRYKPEHAMPGEPYQIKTRSNYKKEFHTELTCCEGYVQSGAMCVPRCPQSCQNGTCKEPDLCTCNTGYRMSSNGSCVSQCTNHTCVNGTCVDSGVCNCNEGYLLDSDGFTCRPVCPVQCEETHGYCTEPNVCTCPSGYRQHKRFDHVFKFMCEPVCDPECENGLCVAPNVCMCADGYEKSTDPYDSFCHPKCGDSCDFGRCESPGFCVCHHGYFEKYHAPNEYVCEPDCVECKMGKCVEPHTCACNEGYRLRNNSEDICEPICENDMCGGGICVAPGTCLHENQTVSNTSVVLSNSTQSKPICTIPCGPNGECTSPNECTCFEGYRSHAQLIITELHENFSKTPFPELASISSEKHICQPVCDRWCYNGKCTAPNVCTCDPGYYPRWLEDSDFESYNFCYRLNGPPCNALSCGDNGTCHESGICVCDDGYRKDTAGACIPICNRGCLDGMCTAPDYCECREGYALQNGKFGQNVCKAICERGCENGECVGPNECICNNGFIPNIDHHSKPECIPVCTRNCSGHGDCIISTDRNHYRCECHFGWTGLDCDQPSLCVIKMAYEKVKKRGMLHFANSTIKRAYEDAPYCSQCYDSLDNKTVCPDDRPLSSHKF
ncbi:Uncharacterized protein DBV15_04418 [Temnothorax longispinosus]|uniref:EGF-like domain-containing protein n=1 Tax=Temnothorax longispinosus TaxID=300112 RepID=A0A4S2K8M8_9HYME|nr:Uncharacterized protein DBV15_04418 [Temnothorax longispinosus]